MDQPARAVEKWQDQPERFSKDLEDKVKQVEWRIAKRIGEVGLTTMVNVARSKLEFGRLSFVEEMAYSAFVDRHNTVPWEWKGTG